MAVPIDFLHRLLDPVAQAMSREMARRLVELRADAATQERIDALAELCNDGQLTADERSEYEFLIAASSVIAVLQEQAVAVLSREPTA